MVIRAQTGLARAPPLVKGVRCQQCGGFAWREPGGARCLNGHLFLDPRILPRNHPLSGWDYKNRQRQLALDRCYTSPGRMPEHVFTMLERLEGERP